YHVRRALNNRGELLDLFPKLIDSISARLWWVKSTHLVLNSLGGNDVRSIS
ncbi:hypothetical protein PanWU01x14_056490, partial [Parasponia andersonii]